MQFLSLLKKCWPVSHGGDTPAGASSQWHIIDPRGLAGNGNGRGRPSPREQFLLLQKVAAFVEKEKLRACVVLEGRPLREAPDGKTFKTSKVVYAEQNSQFIAKVLQLAGSRRGSIIVTNDRPLEQKARERGLATLRATTLRKVWDDAAGGGDGRPANRSRRRQRPRKKPGQGPRGNGRERDDGPQNPGEAPAGNGGGGVSDLIDLV
jgi:hypothetical protein